MAKKDDEAAEGAGEAGEKKPMSTKLVIIIVAVVALVIGGGGAGAAFYFMNKKPDKAAEEKAKAEEAAKPKDAYYHEFKPPFLSNYQWSGRPHYVQMSVAVMARDKDVIALIMEHEPLIRSNVGMLMSGQEFEAMRSPEGKEDIRQMIFNDIQEVLKSNDDETEGIEQVYFTNFVMQ